MLQTLLTRSANRVRGDGVKLTTRQVSRKPQHWVRQLRIAEQSLQSLGDSSLKKQAESLKQRLHDSTPRSSDMVELCALTSEVIFRTQGICLYDVQLQAMGAGIGRNIVEMQTGEGKTVVTGAIAAVKSFLLPTVHVGTTNAYLAARDLESMVDSFDFLGITHGLLPEEPDENTSRRVYRKQIVYGPGYQFGFDYLRDQMELRKQSSNSNRYDHGQSDPRPRSLPDHAAKRPTSCRSDRRS